MKNKAVEAMLRVQFNIPKTVNVRVDCLATVDHVYEFEACWYIDDTMHECEFKIPHIDLTVKDLL